MRISQFWLLSAGFLALSKSSALAATLVGGGLIGDASSTASYDPATGKFDYTVFDLSTQMLADLRPDLVASSTVGSPGNPFPNLNPPLPKSQAYELTFTFPSPPKSASAVDDQVEWEDFYYRQNGKLTTAGGDDDLPFGGGPIVALAVNGSSVTYRFTNAASFFLRGR